MSIKGIKKRIIAVALSIMLAFSLSGCVYSGMSIVLNADGSGTMQAVIEAEKDKYDKYMEHFAEEGSSEDIFAGEVPEVVSKDGVEYYRLEMSGEFLNSDELAESLSEGYTNVIVSDTGILFRMPAEYTKAEYEEIEKLYDDFYKESSGKGFDELAKLEFSFVMPNKISAVSDTGEILPDGKTAVFSFGLADLCKTQECMVSTAAETELPTVSGVKPGSKYNKAVTLSLSDISGIKAATYTKAGGKETSFDFSKKLTRNGKYTVKATDYYDNTATLEFTIKDTKKPTVTGVKNGKSYSSARTIKFKDNCGISKATLNGKKIKSGKKVSAKGSYKLVVTDVNGLKTTLKFKIK